MAIVLADETTDDPSFWKQHPKVCPGKKFKPIKSVQLTVLDQLAIQRMSVCEVTTTTIYEKSLPRAYGINDIRMGTVDRKLRCGTCLNGIAVCNGHTGHIELATPVYHISFLSYVLKILRCVCPHCFRLVVPSSDPDIAMLVERYPDSKERFSMICAHVKTKQQCQHEDCQFWLPKYRQSGLVIKREWSQAARAQFADSAGPRSKKSKSNTGNINPSPAVAQLSSEDQQAFMRPLTALIVRDTLEMMEDDLYTRLGIGIHPRNLIIQTLVVPAPIIRPAINFSESSRCRGQDDLTIRLQDILKTSLRIQQLKNQGDVALTSSAAAPLVEQLQYLCSTYVNNETTLVKVPIKKRSGLPDKCLTKRVRGKKGRVRGNLMGKRVDYSGRTVISPDCQMDVDDIGVPYIVAMKLTFTETVNHINLMTMTQRVHAGANVLHGAKTITKHDGTKVFMEFHKNPKSVRLQLGWQVERYMQDGDVVLFNRQPSLRKKSIMAHKVRLMSGKTFRLNLSCTGPYNGKYSHRPSLSLCLCRVYVCVHIHTAPLFFFMQRILMETR